MRPYTEFKCYVLDANPEFEVVHYNCTVHIFKGYTKMWED